MKDEKSFRRAQNKFIISSAIVYAFFYLTRKNLSMAQPGMLEEGVISTYAVGTMLSLHGILYGLSRFVNGFWADRLNGRIFMTIGLALSALMNFCFGCTSLSVMFAVFWVLNGWTQGMGFPPCAKMLTHWIHPKELATKMSIWNTSHSFGAVMALGLCCYILAPAGWTDCLDLGIVKFSGIHIRTGLGLDWRWCFYIPAILAGLIAVFCFFVVKETPAEAGVEELEIEGASNRKSDSGSMVSTKDRMRLVFTNKVIWLVALSNFFVYIVRFGFLDWGPTFLKQFKGIPVSKGGLMIIAFEAAAIVGTIFAGWATDKWFKGRGVRTCVFCMLFTALCAFGFWFLPQGAPIWQATLLLMGAGFFIYGPQALIGITVANQATKEAAAMANGFTGIMGYLSTLISGIGIAFMKETFGWGPALCAIAAMALVGMVILLFAWNAAADGYGKTKK
jgi:OPA family glycerol-3-phosphate transporter-like MFS transporter/OPA family sugar phosphate sensor protein UhpC-like MFS transporter